VVCGANNGTNGAAKSPGASDDCSRCDPSADRYFSGISILYTIGGILVVIGVVLWVLGAVGRPVGGRKV
jgi:hypothetical protein